MKRWYRKLLPAPTLTLVLTATWLLLNQSASLGQLLLGLLLGVSIALLTDAVSGPRPTLRRPWVAARLALIVLWDIVVSNIAVPRLIVGPERDIRPGFVWFALTLREPHAIVALAGIITMTPGTLSAELSPDQRHLLVHAFNIDDEATLLQSIHTRYELPLLEIFE